VASSQAQRSMITVRALAGRHEYADAVNLQRMVWGWEDLDILPVRFFVVARDIGGQLLGAFDDKFMCGFCVAIPGVHPGAPPYLHSHMLGVLPEYRDAGAGRMLKLAQRDDALARGFDLVEWTFDPLELKNRLFQYRKAGRRHSPISSQSLRHHHQQSRRRPAHRSLRCRMVSETPAPGIPDARAHPRARRSRSSPSHGSR